jgi:hypothetical protein
MWQFSHVVFVGMCEEAPAGEVGGITMMLVIPLKLPLVTLGPWHVAHVTPSPKSVWLNLPPAKVVMAPVAPVAGINIEGMLFT